MTSWLHYPLRDDDDNFCSDLLFSAATAEKQPTMSQTTAVRPPSVKPPVRNFMNFSRMRGDFTGGESVRSIVRESTQVNPSATPSSATATVNCGSGLTRRTDATVNCGSSSVVAGDFTGGEFSKAIVRESTQVNPSATPSSETATMSESGLTRRTDATVNCGSSGAGRKTFAIPGINQKGKAVATPASEIPGTSSPEKTIVDERKRKEREATIDDTESPSEETKGRGTTTCTKRSRAAQVHNLSERKRRDRINERMKALQELIPRCNKSDKASMLDEAIEYLKQLQLQVQMLTMRNGINLHPLCLPGTTLHPLQLSQIRPVIPQEPTNESMLNHTQFASTSNAPDMINTVPSYAMDPSIRSHFGPFPLLTSPVEMSREGGLTHQRLNIGHSNLTGEQAMFDGQQLDRKDRLT